MAQGRFMVAVRVEPSFFTSAAAAAKGQKVSKWKCGVFNSSKNKRKISALDSNKLLKYPELTAQYIKSSQATCLMTAWQLPGICINATKSWLNYYCTYTILIINHFWILRRILRKKCLNLTKLASGYNGTHTVC